MIINPPIMFRSLLWSFKWEDADIERDKTDIIVNTINEGTLAHWRWIIATYGKEVIRKVLSGRLASEFHAESLNLANIIFGLPPLRHAR